MRVGLVGTGPWAGSAHGPGLQQAEGVQLAGVWGRRPERARALGDRLGVTAHDDLDDLLGAVDAVAFAVPPDVQADLALQAAEQGKHLLLDKPVALDTAPARLLAEEVERRGLASVVFFTDRFSADTRRWLDEVATTGGWRGGWARWLSALDAPGNPYADSPWRREKDGALLDIGPHALSTLSAALGPVSALDAVGGPGDLVHLVLTHEGGVTSTVTLTHRAPPAAQGSELALWGEAGTTLMPRREGGGQVAALATAAEELARCVASGEPHPVDVRFGARVVELLVEARRALGTPPPQN